MEEWKDIPGYEGFYQASNLGNIRSLKFWSNVHKKYYKRIKYLKFKPIMYGKRMGKYGSGYKITLYKEGTKKDWRVARLIALTFLGYPPNINYTIDHINGNRLDNRIENLEWVTRDENIKRAFNNNLYNSAKKVFITNKDTNETLTYSSLSKASIAMNKNQHYLSNSIRRGIYENEKYIWELGW